jgi:hypothetical protein
MVLMMCLTTKKTFEVENPEVIVLKNGRYAFKTECPWTHASGKKLYAFKFASKKAHEAFVSKASGDSEHGSGDSEHTSGDSEHDE